MLTESKTGADLFIVVPSPSWPVELRPQAYSLFDEFIAIACDNPALTSFHFVLALIKVGEDLFTVVPSPNWPTVLTPQAHNEESSALIATAKELPAEMCFQEFCLYWISLDCDNCGNKSFADWEFPVNGIPSSP